MGQIPAGPWHGTELQQSYVGPQGNKKHHLGLQVLLKEAITSRSRRQQSYFPGFVLTTCMDAPRC